MKARPPFQLNVWPVVQRELREGARRPFNYWLRVGSAAAGLLVLLFIAGTSIPAQGAAGLQLFVGLHTLMLGLICAIVPAMTADCIAREKREGTLGLLFLTPLSSGGIVLGKSLVQAFRALTLCLAVLPVLVIPFVVGGVGAWDVLSAITIEFCVALLCLAAGLLASSLATSRAWAYFLAVTLGVIFVSGYVQLLALIVNSYGVYFGGDIWNLGVGLVTGQITFLYQSTALPMGWSTRLTVSVLGPFFRMVWPTVLWQTALLIPLLSLLVIALAGRILLRDRQDKTPSTLRQSWIKRYCSPVFRTWFSRRLGRSLDRNPIAWLQQYSWKARFSKWGLCVAFIIAEGLVQSNDPDQILLIQLILSLALVSTITFVGVSTFLQEKRSGALELILITPIRVDQIIFGRAWGLWKQFLPAALVIVIYSAGALRLLHYNFHHNDDDFPLLPMTSLVLCAYLSLPIFTTYFALRVKNLIAASVLTWVAVVVSISFGASVMQTLSMLITSDEPSEFQVALGFFLGSLSFTLLTCFLLRHSLYRRIYSF